jgi:hypothetical protein
MSSEEPYHHPDHSVTPRTHSHSRNKQHETKTQNIDTTTHIVPLRSRVAAGFRHKPPRHIKMTVCTGQKKSCATILITASHQEPIVTHATSSTKR